MAILLLGRALLGVGESFVITGALSWVLAIMGPQYTGRAMAWLGSALYAAFAVGAPAGTALYTVHGFAAIALAATQIPLLAPAPGCAASSRRTAAARSRWRASAVPYRLPAAGCVRTRSHAGAGAISRRRCVALPQPIEASADVKPGDAGQRFSMHAFGAVFVEVAVDPDLGETRVRRILGAYGAGRIVNPKMARSQRIGGMIGGVGMAPMEPSVVGVRNGRVPNANLSEYAVPLHADAPRSMDVIFVEEHDPHVNPLGREGRWRDRHGRRCARHHEARHRQPHS